MEMEVIYRLKFWQRKKGLIRLTCSKKHLFYLRGHLPFRIGSVKSPIAYVKCPKCEEKISGGEIL